MAEVGELSVRRQEAGGPVADRVNPLGPLTPAGKRNFVLLVHGYANSQPVASKSFDKCIQNMEELARDANTILPSAIFKFYWPGDTRLPVVSQLSYPWEIGPAVSSAAKLADYLKGVAGPGGTGTQIHLVAHSLGSRLILEMLSHFLSGDGSVRFASMSLMAAAVPVRRVKNSHQLLRASTVPDKDKRQVLCSSTDLVLMIAFRMGETFAREGIFPEAVGSYGHPDELWQKQKMDGYGHSDYWPSRLAALHLCRVLGIPVAHATPENGIPAREVASPRDLPVRQQPENSGPQARSLPGSH